MTRMLADWRHVFVASGSCIITRWNTHPHTQTSIKGNSGKNLKVRSSPSSFTLLCPLKGEWLQGSPVERAISFTINKIWMWDELWLYLYKYLRGRWRVKRENISACLAWWQSFNGWSMAAASLWRPKRVSNYRHLKARLESSILEFSHISSALLSREWRSKSVVLPHQMGCESCQV